MGNQWLSPIRTAIRRATIPRVATARLSSDEFVIDQYLTGRPFASFLPGIAGPVGIPMWVFYVNRGQAIAGFGLQDKDHPIMEFQPANRAYRTVALQGFRTFIRFSVRGKVQVYEPFRLDQPGAPQRQQRMRIRRHDLVLEESHAQLGLEISVHYTTLANQPIAGLARMVTLRNLTARPRTVEIVDGLPAMVPSGLPDRFLKDLSRTMEAWITVENTARGAPLFRLKVDPHDRPEVTVLRRGNFAAGFVDENGRITPTVPIIDPTIVFGAHEDLQLPERLFEPRFHIPRRPSALDRTPSALGYATIRLPARGERTVYALYGAVDSLDQLNAWLPRLRQPKLFHQNARAQQQLIDELTQPVAMASGDPRMDAYVRQTFLDNVLRGGAPVRVGAAVNSPAVYLYARKHGDLERDYNYFVIPPTYYSQGNANYRDVNQNRRNDVWFFPWIGEHNVRTFFNLLQADGFNPLVFNGTRFVCPSFSGSSTLRALVTQPFTPGELLQHLEQAGALGTGSSDALVSEILAAAEPIEDAEPGEGFWTDHWTYNLDLLESYLAVYPERLAAVLIGEPVFTFYDNPFVVVPRHQRYRMVDGRLRQMHAVVKDPEKAELIARRTERPHVVRAAHGRGEIYRTTLLAKLVCVVANKIASLDLDGIGVEMEAGKPNWFDALNGLPGLFGSSSCETFELKRWLLFLLTVCERLGDQRPARVAVPQELHELLTTLESLLPLPAAAYWQRAGDAKERYREQVRLGFSGAEHALSFDELIRWLTRARDRINQALVHAYDSATGLYTSYFCYEITSWQDQDGHVRPTAWRRHNLPPFLEGMVHALRVEADPARARQLHAAVRRSGLYDRKLGMYRVCASLADESPDIGRCQIFNPGWLENQSVWLHMEYKYLLELLRSGLADEFYAAARTALIPFQPPARYGRSILENCSFLVSSVYADSTLHGAGFVARLSGATAEFLHLWLLMLVGRQPLRVDGQGRLTFHIAPLLTGRLFTRQGLCTFVLFGQTQVVYRNRSRRPTYGAQGVVARHVRLTPCTGQPMAIEGATIPAPYAEQLRRGEIVRMEVEFA